MLAKFVLMCAVVSTCAALDFASLFGNGASSLGGLTNLAGGTGGTGALAGLTDLAKPATKPATNPATTGILDQKGINSAECQQSSSKCNEGLGMDQLLGQFDFGGAGVGKTLMGAVAKNQKIDLCKKKEDPKSPLSFSAIEDLLKPGGLQSSLQRSLKQQCQSQFDAEKERCEGMKRTMCTIMQDGLASKCTFALITDSLAKESGAKTGKDACLELSKLAKPGGQVDTGSLIDTLVKGGATSGVASGLSQGGTGGLLSGGSSALGNIGSLSKLASLSELFGGGLGR